MGLKSNNHTVKRWRASPEAAGTWVRKVVWLVGRTGALSHHIIQHPTRPSGQTGLLALSLIPTASLTQQPQDLNRNQTTATNTTWRRQLNYLAAAALLHAMFSSQIDSQQCEHKYNSEEKRSLTKSSSILSESHAQRIYYLLHFPAQPLNSETEQTKKI